MKIGIIGSGNMGRTIGLALAQNGHDVFFGSRNERDIQYAQQFSTRPLVHGSLLEAVHFGDLLLYSLRDVLPSTIAGQALWSGKVIIDCNNGTIPEGFNFKPVIHSFTERYQKDVPGAHVVKAFNCAAQEIYHHDRSVLSAYNIMSPIAGNNTEAKKLVSALLREIGLVPIDIGTVEQATLLESLADLVRTMMIRNEFGAYLVFTAQQLPETQYRFGERQATKYQ
jgi:8-hydroxy-5-deazaflavin:NADPH oxidoreductase